MVTSLAVLSCHHAGSTRPHLRLHQTWAQYCLGLWLMAFSIFLPKKISLEGKIGSKTRQNLNPLIQSFLEGIQKTFFMNVVCNCIYIQRYFKNICLGTCNIHRKECNQWKENVLVSEQHAAWRQIPAEDGKSGCLNFVFGKWNFEILKLNPPWASHIFIWITQAYKRLKKLGGIILEKKMRD